MKLVFNLLLIVSGLAGVVVCFVSDISVSSSLYMIDGLELSIILGVFSAVILLNGLINLFSND